MTTVLSSLILALAPQGEAVEPTALQLRQAAAELHRIAGIQDPQRRAESGSALRQRVKASPAAWAEALRGFSAYAAVKPGVSEVEVGLFVGKGLERTRLHIFVPGTYRPKTPSPLLLVGHGTGGEGGGMLRMWQGLAERCGLLVVAPSEAGPNGGWAFSNRERQSALSALRYMRRRFNVDDRRVFVTGVSRGGHMSWDLGLRFPDRFAAIIPMIGGPRIRRVQGQNNLRFIEHLVTLPVCDLQGAKDDPYLVANVRLAFRWLKELGARDAVYHEFPQLGHSFDTSVVDWPKRFAAWQRAARPDRVLRRCAHPREGRSFWLEVTRLDKKIKEVPRIRATSRYAKLSETGKREYVARQLARLTARAEAVLVRPGRIEIKQRAVLAVRVYLDPGMFVPGKKLAVRFRNRTRYLEVVPDPAVLIGDFLERQDRSFLPVAAVKIR